MEVSLSFSDYIEESKHEEIKKTIDFYVKELENFVHKDYLKHCSVDIYISPYEHGTYNEYHNEIKVDPDDLGDTLMHELMHVVEKHNPILFQLAKEFIDYYVNNLSNYQLFSGDGYSGVIYTGTTEIYSTFSDKYYRNSDNMNWFNRVFPYGYIILKILKKEITDKFHLLKELNSFLEKQKEKEKTYLKENKNFEKILKEIVFKKGII